MKEIEDLHRLTIGCLLQQTKNKLFFTDQEFKQHYGRLMVAAQLRNSIEKQVKELCHRS